jgi:ribosome-associated translation inhibitor RaiA
MQVHVNANNSVHTHEPLERWAREELNASLRRFGNDITSVEMHLSDEDSDRISAEHKRCMLEARLANHPPVAVNHQAGSLDDAIRGAIDKLRRALDHTFGKLRDQRDRTSIRRAGEPPDDAAPTAGSGSGPHSS